MNLLRPFLAAVAAFLIWGFLPFYWKALKEINALEVLAYRIVMTFILLVVYQFFTNRNTLIKLFNTITLKKHVISSIFLASNWLIYVWGVVNNHIIECSLGYYLTPLVSVFLGGLIFKEQFSNIQKISIILATLSVVNIIVSLKIIPFIAIGLAFSFSMYSVFRKKSNLSSIDGLTVESFLLSIPFATYIFTYGSNLITISPTISFLLLFSGVVTATPLLLYVYSIRELPLSTVGMLQYIGPTLMFLIGLFYYKESFSLMYFLSFLIIWLAVILFTYESIKNR
ncbi:chloramphenicol-sensitive protein RarD [Deferribacter desulfuricans SSM1]|uniref:Chloramphenicol-sensitive protein RarD n=1 Tax=Deferribacter desulfuricans (strain DSM 14783 / JCM 11476 / NBRC 101012 / SSM1) TaxID=639282 RepID=D3PCS6_DEFDS|nr:EamA family transporter RarD [Deferribacter desulfuricans]BAI80399.1 chloramphenicol-sensitive protein RarD [Deferribacter desulfuricans SSM1]